MCGYSDKPASKPLIMLNGKYGLARREYFSQAAAIRVPLILFWLGTSGTVGWVGAGVGRGLGTSDGETQL